MSKNTPPTAPPEQTGPELRDHALTEALEHTPANYLSIANDVLLMLAQHGAEFTVETVRSRIGFDPPRQGTMGALVASALRTGLIKSIGFTKAKRPSSHRRYLQCFIGA
jgi:hypothetical protein